MKKVLKIIAFVLLIALAVVCLVKMIQYISIGYNTIYSYFYILLKSKFSDPQHQMHALSYLGIIFTCFINLIIYTLLVFFLCKNTKFIKNAVNVMKEWHKKLKAHLTTQKQERKQKKIQNMKSKIEKMESDE